MNFVNPFDLSRLFKNKGDQSLARIADINALYEKTKKYEAIIRQTGINDPVLVSENDPYQLALSFTRDAAGDYYSTDVYDFENDDVLFEISNSYTGPLINSVSAFYHNGYFYIKTYNSTGASVDDILSNSVIRIKLLNQ